MSSIFGKENVDKPVRPEDPAEEPEKSGSDARRIKAMLLSYAKEKSALQAERDLYKADCANLRQDLTSQLNSAKDKLEYQSREVRTLHGYVIQALANLLRAPEVDRNSLAHELRRIKGLLDKYEKASAGTTELARLGCTKVERGSQTSGEAVDYDKKIAEMRDNISGMKKGMQELEKIYAAEIEKKTQEHKVATGTLQAQVRNLQSAVAASKQELDTLHAHVTQAAFDKRQLAERNGKLTATVAQLVELLQSTHGSARDNTKEPSSNTSGPIPTADNTAPDNRKCSTILEEPTHYPTDGHSRRNRTAISDNDNVVLAESSLKMEEGLMVRTQNDEYSWKSIDSSTQQQNQSGYVDAPGSQTEEALKSIKCTATFRKDSERNAGLRPPESHSSTPDSDTPGIPHSSYYLQLLFFSLLFMFWNA